MAVSKELLARYKEMKAKGVNITLTELKKQMEEEENSGLPSPQEQSVQSGVASSQFEQSSQENSWTTTYSNNSYSSQNEEQPVPSSLEQTSFVENVMDSQSSLHSSTTSSFSNLYPKEPVQSEQHISSEQNTQEAYSSNSFSNSFDVSVNSSFFRPQVTNDYVQNSVDASVPASESSPAQSQNTTTVEDEKIFAPDSVNAPTRKYALIGYPLGHSLSSYIHEAGFKSLGLKASYEILETPPETLVDRIKFFKSHGYRGFNVTIPLKLPITMFLDSVDASADIVNAVNTVVIDPQTREMKGYNTDVLGFRNAIPEDVTLCGKVAGVLGTGGAARAAITALAQSQMKEIKLFTRNVPNSLELVNYLRKTFPNVEFNTYQIERIRDLSDIDLLVNTTPIGMLGRGADFTPVEENELRTLKQGAVVYDVIYNPKKTILLKLAQKYGYRTINGVDMFIHQALAAEQIWTGRTPDFKDMKIAALENL